MKNRKATKAVVIDQLLQLQAIQTKQMKKHIKLGNTKIVETLKQQIDIINQDLAKMLIK